VTSGTSTTASLDAAGLGGRSLSWQDVLYEGPVPAGLDDRGLADVRAGWAEARGWATRAAVGASYAARDAALAQAAHVVLWFEHDLHDALQLLQVLERLSRPAEPPPRLEGVLVDRVEGRAEFHGLGELTAAELAALWPARAPLTPGQLELGRRGWVAFTARDPLDLEALVHAGTPELPALGPALRRLLEELPGDDDGLSRGERQLLRVVADGADTPEAAFHADAACEEARFAGDGIVFARLASLAAGPVPLLTGWPDAPLALTRDGRRVLAGEADAVRLRGLDRWLGGTRLDASSAWRWDRRANSVRRR
jgi:hypothetical protein